MPGGRCCCCCIPPQIAHTHRQQHQHKATAAQRPVLCRRPFIHSALARWRCVRREDAAAAQMTHVGRQEEDQTDSRPTGRPPHRRRVRDRDTQTAEMYAETGVVGRLAPAPSTLQLLPRPSVCPSVGCRQNCIFPQAVDDTATHTH